MNNKPEHFIPPEKCSKINGTLNLRLPVPAYIDPNIGSINNIEYINLLCAILENKTEFEN